MENASQGLDLVDAGCCRDSVLSVRPVSRLSIVELVAGHRLSRQR